jgi:hypothetical protein
VRSRDDARLKPFELSRALRAQVGFELALAGQLPDGLSVTRPPRRLLSLAARAAITLPAGPVTFRSGTIEADGCRFELADQAGLAHPYVPVTGDIVLALEDNNPLAMYEAHPDKQGNAIDLGGQSVEAWRDTLRQALGLVEEFLPTLRGEIDLFVQQLVPVGYDEHRHLSASYQEGIGTIYLTLHPNLMTMTEALIHEFSHNKINALFELDAVLENAWWPLYASPVRRVSARGAAVRGDDRRGTSRVEEPRFSPALRAGQDGQPRGGSGGARPRPTDRRRARAARRDAPLERALQRVSAGRRSSPPGDRSASITALTDATSDGVGVDTGRASA